MVVLNDPPVPLCSLSQKFQPLISLLWVVMIVCWPKHRALAFFWYKFQWPSGWSRPIWSLKVGPTCIMHHGQPDDLDLDFSELLIWVEPTNPSYKRRIFKIPHVKDVCPLIYSTNICWEVQGARKMFSSVFLSYPFFRKKRRRHFHISRMLVVLNFQSIWKSHIYIAKGKKPGSRSHKNWNMIIPCS